jgi:hypothetical protein
MTSAEFRKANKAVLRRFWKPTRSFFEEFARLGSLSKHTFIIASGEADLYIGNAARLDMEAGRSTLVISSDSDFTFGYQIDRVCLRNKQKRLFRIDNILAKLKISAIQYRTIGILAGTDYNKSVFSKLSVLFRLSK